MEDEKVKLGAAQAPEGLGAAQSANVERAIEESFISGYRVVMLVAAGTALASALSAAILIEGKKPGRSAEQPNVEEEIASDPLEP